MEGYTAADLDANGGDLALVGPDSGVAGLAVGGDAHLGQRGDYDLLESADILHRPAPVLEIHDRVDDQLSGPVVGHLAPTVGLEHGNALCRQVCFGQQHVGLFAQAALGVDVRVLQHKHGVRFLARVDLLHQRQL